MVKRIGMENSLKAFFASWLWEPPCTVFGSIGKALNFVIYEI
jgi:hypothetical protein